MFKIKKEITGIFQLLSPLFNESNLINRKKVPVFLPFYHHVSNDECDYIKPLYAYRNVKEFERDLDFYLKNFTLVDASTLVDSIKNGISYEKKPICHLSFDDGLKSCSTVIAPILKSKGIPATFFVSPSFVNGDSVFYRFKVGRLISTISSVKESNKNEVKRYLLEKHKWKGSFKHSLLDLTYNDEAIINDLLDRFKLQLSSSEVYMNVDDIDNLIKSGFTIGAHSMNHPEYSKIDFEEQIKQTVESLDWVMDKFQMNHRLFSFPFTNEGIKDEFYNWMFDAGNPVVDLAFGTAGLKYSRYQQLLQRVPIELYMSKIDSRVKAEYMYFNLLNILNKSTQYT